MNNWSVLRCAVMGLILCGVVTIVSVALLVAQGNAVPDGLTAIGGTAVGALATLMVSQHDRRDDPPR